MTVEARLVAEEAEAKFLALPLARNDDFESYYSYLIVDEPAVHLMPVHFLPAQCEWSIDEGCLRGLGVAAKLEYARNRWLDEMADANGATSLTPAAHRLNDEVLKLTDAHYAEVMRRSAAASFFSIVANLHARHALSLILDSAWTKNRGLPITLEEYITHAMARHGPFRASVDAVLLLADAQEHQRRRARAAWHYWALGVQFYDDALDAEEDFRDGNLSWVVERALDSVRVATNGNASRDRIDQDSFYEAALTRGVIREALAHAESFFAESARQADPDFPSWAKFQRTCVKRARNLREDYEKLGAKTGEA